MRGDLFKNRIKQRPRVIKPVKFIADFIDSPLNPLNINPVIGIDPAMLALEEYNRTCDIYENRFNSRPISDRDAYQLIQALWNEIARLESPHAQELEAIGVQAIKKLYNLPDDIEVEAEISHGPCGDFLQKQDHAQPQLSPERMEYIQEQIQKRILLNSLVHGSSKHAWKTLHYLVEDEIKKINPNLFDLYNKLTALTSMMLWRQDQWMLDMMQENKGDAIGECKVEFTDEGATLTSKASCMPVLLCELNKSLFDYVICAGIPTDLTDDELMYYYNQADDYTLEPWMYFVGPSLWEKLITTARQPSENLPEMVARLSELTLGQLTDLFQLMLDDQKEEANTMMKELKLI